MFAPVLRLLSIVVNHVKELSRMFKQNNNNKKNQRKANVSIRIQQFSLVVFLMFVYLLVFMLNARCSMFGIQCSMFNAQCSAFTVQCTTHHWSNNANSVSYICFFFLLSLSSTGNRYWSYQVSFVNGNWLLHNVCTKCFSEGISLLFLSIAEQNNIFTIHT